MSIPRLLIRRLDRDKTEPGFSRSRDEPGSQTKTNKGDLNMRYMMIVKAAENQGPPPKALMEAIDKLSEDASKAGTMLGGGGLGPTGLGARVRLSGGKVTVTDGPFTEAKEVVGGYAQFELKSKKEAADAAVILMGPHKQHWPRWEGGAE